MTDKQETYGHRLGYLFSDDFADVLICKLSAKDLDRLVAEVNDEREGYLRRWCQQTMKLKLQRDRMAALENQSKEPQAAEAHP